MFQRYFSLPFVLPIRLGMLGLLLGVCPELLYGQASVRGSVIDKQTRTVLPGATIILQPQEEAKMTELLYAFQGVRASMNLLSGDNTSGAQRYGAVSMRNGTYEVKGIKPGTYLLTVRSIGYKKTTQTITIDATNANDAKEITQELIPDVQGLQLVVVTGVASKRAKEWSEVSVGRVDMKTLTENVSFSDPLQGLIAKVPGLFMQFSNGSLGSGVRINVRPSASLLGGQPVIFIDGVRSTGVDYHAYPFLQLDEISPLATLAPDDIETIEVLRGPVASSLYGTSGQNGVIMISTKRGRNLTSLSDTSTATDANALRVNYRFLGGWQEAHRGFSEEITINAANANRFLRLGPTMGHQLTLQGNFGTVCNYYASLVQRNETGIIPGSSMNNTSARLNLDLQPLPGFLTKFSASISNSFFEIPLPNEANGIFYSLLTNTLGGNVNRNRFFIADSASILALQNNISASQVLGSIDVIYSPTFLPGLQIRALGAMEEVRSRGLTFYPPGFAFSSAPGAAPGGGSRLIRNFAPSRLNFDAHISYTGEVLPDFNASVITGVQAYDNRLLLDNMSASTFLSPLLPAIQLGTQERSLTEIDERLREAGIFLRAETNYKQTFFLSGGVRNDYATALGLNSPNILYSQASFAVRLDKLDFLPKEINLFKVRGGYGESGKLPNIRQSSIYWKIFSGPGTSLTGISGNQLFVETPVGDASIRPERIQEFEIGTDIEINDSYGAEINGFYQTSRDAILEASGVASQGISSVAENTGRLRGWGAEALIYGRVVHSQDVSLSLNLNAAYSDNVVDSVGRNQVPFRERSFFAGPSFLGPSNYIVKGERRGLFMDRPPIAPRFLPNGYYDWQRGPVLDSVLRPLGSSVPLLTGAFSWTLTFLRDFSFYGMVDIGIGRYILNSTRQQAAAAGSNPAFNRMATRLGLAKGQAGDIGLGIIPTAGITPLAPNTPEYRATAEEFMQMDTRFGNVANYLERADWLRLRELSLTWNARSVLVNAVVLPKEVRSLVLGLSVRNAFLWTTYSGAETEINSPANIPSRAIAQSSDIWSLMQARTFTFRLDIGF